MIEIKVNSNPKQVKPGSVIYDLLSDKQKESRFVVIECNKVLIDKEKWRETQLKNSDEVNIIGFVGGG